jgi:hypothetical protein
MIPHASLSLSARAKQLAGRRRVPATEVAAWAGHSVEVLMRVYARCVAGLEDVWIARMDASLGRAAAEAPRQETPTAAAHKRTGT